MSSLYEAAGGRSRLLAMTEAFYARAVADNLLGPMFGRASGEHARHLAGWLSASFGGPTDYLAERGDLRFVVWKHANLKITEAQRARWSKLMMASAVEVGLPETFLVPYARFVDSVTRSVRANSQIDLAVLRAELGLGPDEDLEPLRPETPS